MCPLLKVGTCKFFANFFFHQKIGNVWIPLSATRLYVQIALEIKSTKGNTLTVPWLILKFVQMMLLTKIIYFIT